MLQAILERDKTGCWERTKSLYNFLSETKEYSDPHEYGWRIKRRRMFLVVGAVLFTGLVIHQGGNG